MTKMATACARKGVRDAGILPWQIVCLCVTVTFVGIFDRDLWTPDAPRVAAISLEMSRTGDIVVPRLAGRPFVEKPPLYFAVAAAATRVVGPITGNTGAIRLTSALWALGTLVFTFLLARRMAGSASAWLATAILGTMTGFVHNMHWVRVDTALIFFVTAAIWSFAEAYWSGRRSLLSLGGLFTAGAFLSKGIIGPAFVGIAWLGIAGPRLARQTREQGRSGLWVGAHLACLAVFVCFAAAWMVALRVKGGEALWHEWFFDNHFGRLTGAAEHLGHNRAGRPFYYVKTMVYHTLPWFPLVVMWFVHTGRDLARNRMLSREQFMLLVWSVGALVFLTLSVTKRDLYLLPLFPAFAIMSALVLEREELPRWVRVFAAFWLGLCILVLAGCASSSLIMPCIPSALLRNPRVMPCLGFLRTFTLRHAVAGTALALSLFMIMRWRRRSAPLVWLVVTAALYVGAFSVAGKAVDLSKSMKDGVVAFASRIPPDQRARVAGRAFSETMQACFCYYCDWTVPQVNDPARVRKVLAKRDAEFDTMISRHPVVPEPPGLPYHVLAEADACDASHKRALNWIAEPKGNDAQ